MRGPRGLVVTPPFHQEAPPPASGLRETLRLPAGFQHLFLKVQIEHLEFEKKNEGLLARRAELSLRRSSKVACMKGPASSAEEILLRAQPWLADQAAIVCGHDAATAESEDGTLWVAKTFVPSFVDECDKVVVRDVNRGSVLQVDVATEGTCPLQRSVGRGALRSALFNHLTCRLPSGATIGGLRFPPPRRTYVAGSLAPAQIARRVFPPHR